MPLSEILHRIEALETDLKQYIPLTLGSVASFSLTAYDPQIFHRGCGDNRPRLPVSHKEKHVGTHGQILNKSTDHWATAPHLAGNDVPNFDRGGITYTTVESLEVGEETL